MPPQPFPLPLRIGTDICHTLRIFKHLVQYRQTKCNRFAKRILTPEEWLQNEEGVENTLKICKDPEMTKGATLTWSMPGSSRRKPLADGETSAEMRCDVASFKLRKLAYFLAGRFAAKEAIMKSHPERKLTYWDIKILAKESGPDGRSQPPEAFIKSLSGSWDDGIQVPISISHDGEYATATAIGYDPAAAATHPVDGSVRQARSKDERRKMAKSPTAGQLDTHRQVEESQKNTLLKRESQILSMIKELGDRSTDTSQSEHYYVRVLNLSPGMLRQITFTGRVGGRDVHLRGRVRRKPGRKPYVIFELPLNVTKEAGCEMISKSLALRARKSQPTTDEDHSDLMFVVGTKAEFAANMHGSEEKRYQRLLKGLAKGPNEKGPKIWVPPNDSGHDHSIQDGEEHGEEHSEQDAEGEGEFAEEKGKEM